MTQDVMNLRIVRREEQADDVVVIDLADASGANLPPFEPGAHVDLHVGPGLVRQYSLAGSPADRGRYRLGILRDPFPAADRPPSTATSGSAGASGSAGRATSFRWCRTPRTRS